jgi:hypothetical protein
VAVPARHPWRTEGEELEEVARRALLAFVSAPQVLLDSGVGGAGVDEGQARVNRFVVIARVRGWVCEYTGSVDSSLWRPLAGVAAAPLLPLPPPPPRGMCSVLREAPIDYSIKTAFRSRSSQ